MSGKEVARPGILQALCDGRITNGQAATALRLTVRQVQRLKGRYRASGAAGLVHRRRGQPAPRPGTVARRAQITTLMRTQYAGLNDVHLTEKLREVHGLAVSPSTVRRVRRAAGIAPTRRRRAPIYRRRRVREAAIGSLVQIDGSWFDWLEGRGPAMTLLGAIDDASGQVLALHFRPAEDLHGYVTLCAQLFTTYGLPVSLYGDRLNVFVRNDAHWSLAEQLQGAQYPTHFGRILQELGVGYIAAQSPQGKGRIERLWQTLQDRLVSELRLRRIATRAMAQAFLPSFIADFNRRFALPPATARAAWRRPPRRLAQMLSCRYVRRVGRDHTVTLGDRCVQLPRGRASAAGRVEVRELLDGRLLIFHAGHCIATQPAPRDFTLKPRHGPHVDRQERHAPRLPVPAAARDAPSARATTAPRPAASRPTSEHPWSMSIKRHVLRKALNRRG